LTERRTRKRSSALRRCCGWTPGPAQCNIRQSRAYNLCTSAHGSRCMTCKTSRCHHTSCIACREPRLRLPPAQTRCTQPAAQRGSSQGTTDRSSRGMKSTQNQVSVRNHGTTFFRNHGKRTPHCKHAGSAHMSHAKSCSGSCWHSPISHTKASQCLQIELPMSGSSRQSWQIRLWHPAH
jgi:hypothetical protein